MPKTNTKLSTNITNMEQRIILERLGYKKQQPIQYNSTNNYNGNNYIGNSYTGNNSNGTNSTGNGSIITNSLFDSSNFQLTKS